MKHYKHIIIAFFAIVVLGTPWLVSSYPASTKFVDNLFSYIGKNYTAVFFQQGITIAQLQNKYNAATYKKNQPKIRIMIVPGHEPNFGGSSYGGVNERDMAVDLANSLRGFLQNNSHYEVIVSRTKDAWNPDIEKYFKDHWDDIVAFIKENKEQMIRLVNNGSVRMATEGISHSSAPQNVAIRLFGINKWNNENAIDIAIHIHFNDYERRNLSAPGEYTGLAIYVPEKQYSNSATTKAIANSVYKRLSKYNAVSNFPKEDVGVVEDQELIAIGSRNTLDAPSMLIEYGYVYEPQFSDPTVRDSTLKDLAFQTYLGLQDFFGGPNDISIAYDTLMLPHSWIGDISKKNADKNDVLALQSALIVEGVYPPSDKSKNDCPRTGRLGPCTLSALNQFQNKYGIKDEVNIVGEQTKKVLNDRYSARVR